MRELRKQGYDKPIVGETTLSQQKVIDSPATRWACPLMHGCVATRRRCEYKSDHNGLKGYSAMYGGSRR